MDNTVLHLGVIYYYREVENRDVEN